MTCISDHAKILLTYYKVIWQKENEWDRYNPEEVEELYADLKDAEKRAEKLAENSEFFVDIDEVRIIQDDKRIFINEYHIKHV